MVIINAINKEFFLKNLSLIFGTICLVSLFSVSTVIADTRPAIECQNNVSCFIEAGKTCRRAIYYQEEKNITPQSEITTLLRYEIHGHTDGRCDVTMDVEDVKLEFLGKYLEALRRTGLTNDSIEKVQMKADEMQRQALVGRQRQSLQLEPKVGFIQYFTKVNEANKKSYKMTPHGYLKDANGGGRFRLDRKGSGLNGLRQNLSQ